MPVLDIRLSGDRAFEDEDILFADQDGTTPIRVALLKKGMKSGKHSVAIGIQTPEGWIIAQTSLELFQAAANAMKTRSEMDNAGITG